MEEIERPPVVSAAIPASVIACGLVFAGLPEPQIKYAEWRTKPCLPWPLWAKFLRFPWKAWANGLCILCGFTMATQLFDTIWLAGCGTFLCIVTGLMALNIRHYEVPRDIREILDVPSDERQFPVSLNLYSSTVQIGSDRGIITFTRNLMHFEGMRTSFDVPLLCDGCGARGLARSSRHLVMGKRIAWEGGHILVIPYTMCGHFNSAVGFFAALSAAHASRSLSPRFLVLPPNSPQPQLFKKLRKSVRICRMIAIGSFIAEPVAILFARLESSSGGWVVAVICSLFALLFETASADNKRHIVKLQSLACAEPDQD